MAKPTVWGLLLAVLALAAAAVEAGSRKGLAADRLDSGLYVQCNSRDPACLQAEVVALRMRLYRVSREYGLLACKHTGFGPTGGSCLTTETREVGGNHFLDEGLATQLVDLFGHGRVLDLGAGVGHYGVFLKARGVDWTGYDGAENMELGNGNVHFADLTTPQWFGQKFDWVMSLEVAEHIPVEHQETYLENLFRHAATGVVLSWGSPGQGGHRHVSLRSNEEVISILGSHGFPYDAETTQRLREHTELSWLSNNVMVFHNSNNATEA